MLETLKSKFQAFLYWVKSLPLRDYKQVGLLATLFFVNGSSYHLLRITKDSLVVTAPHAGAEVLPFLKVWLVLPAAFLGVSFLMWLSRHFSRDKIFYMVMGCFFLFFLIFLALLFPWHGRIHPHHFCDLVEECLPSGSRGLIALIRNWTFTLFYISGELWSTMIITVLLWGYANDISTMANAKRFYGILAVGFNLSGVFAGHVSVLLSKLSFNGGIFYGDSAWTQIFFWHIVIVMASILLSLMLFFYIERSGMGYHGIKGSGAVDSTLLVEDQDRGGVERFGVWKSLAFIGKSRYWIFLALVVFGYNMSINLVEVIWKDRVQLCYPDPQQFNACIGAVGRWTGVMATVLCLCSSWLLKRFDWRYFALIGPVLVLFSGLAFFASLFLLPPELDSVGGWALLLSVWLGSVQVCLTRVVKYSVFDLSKEMLYIPMKSRSRVRVKAVVDGMISRLGKSGGSLVLQLFCVGFGSLSQSIIPIALVFFSATGTWLWAMCGCIRGFTRLTNRKRGAKIAPW